MAEDDPGRVGDSIFGQQLLLLLFAMSGVGVHVGSEVLEHLALAIDFVVLLRVDNHVHTIALGLYLAGCHQVRADGILLREVRREVHFLPLELFLEVVAARKPKFAEVPAFDEINLAV